MTTRGYRSLKTHSERNDKAFYLEMARSTTKHAHVDADAEGPPFENYELIESIRSMLEKHNVVMADMRMLEKQNDDCGSDEN
jgi:hypothetical protein